MGRHSFPSHAPSANSKLHAPLFIGICALIAYTTWARGGTASSLHPPILALSVMLLIFTLLGLNVRLLRQLLRDPVTWLGLGFLLLIGVQTWNAGRYLYFNPVAERWMHTAPPVPHAPWAFVRTESLEMIYWFMPPWALALALRHVPEPKRLARGALAFFLVNGVALALFGLVQHVAGTDLLYGFSDAGRGAYYASFGYRNHAAAYLLLVLATALGYMAYRQRQRWFIAETRLAADGWLAGVAALVVFIAIHPALGRAVIGLAWVLVLVCLAGFFLRHQAHTPSARLQLAVIILLGSGIALCWIVVFGGDALFRRMDGPVVDTLWNNIRNRAWMWSAAIGMWEDHKLWGVGGWGYRHLLPLYAEGAGLSEVHLPGKANAHNDALQFLAEFGTIGFGLLLGATLVLIGRFIRGWRRAWGRPSAALYAATAAGFFFIGLHSLLDLPFRNPAMLQACVLLLVAVPAAWSREPSKQRP